jgi:glycosyltransferase involved in cell wall biosynthesis
VPLHVAHVVLSLDCGGLERVVLGLLRAGRGQGQSVSVVCVERPGALAAQAEAAGVRVVSADKPPGLRLGTVRRLEQIFGRLRPDVVHTHQIGPLLYAGPAARAAGVPVVVHTEHGNHLAGLTPWVRRVKARLLWRYASRRAARFFCVSADIAGAVRAAGVRPEKVLVVANGIATDDPADPAEVDEARRALGLPAGAPVVGTVGRLAEVKRQDLLLRAFARVLNRRPDARLVLVGEGERRAALEALAGELGLADSVRFAGYQPRPEVYLRLMDVFALTSRSEGMPMALLEAWAAGVPVVASRVGGIPELVADGRTGLLFDFPDADTLGGLLTRLLDEPALARGLAEGGRREVEAKYDERAVARAYAGHYHQLLDGRPGSRPASPREGALSPSSRE